MMLRFGSLALKAQECGTFKNFHPRAFGKLQTDAETFLELDK